MNILITGGNGRLGREVATFLLEQGHFVKSMGRKPIDFEVQNYSWALGMSPNPMALKNTDFILHLAWNRQDKSNNSFHLNLGGSMKVFEAADLAGIKVFNFSSISAANPISIYGRTKRLVEIENSKGVNLRIAKVECNRNFQLTMKSEKRYRGLILLPLPGNLRVHVISLDSFLKEIQKFINGEFSPGTYTLPSQSYEISDYFKKFYGVNSFTAPHSLFELLFKFSRVSRTRTGFLMYDRWISLKSSSMVGLKS